ncbi:Arl8a protein [Mycena olivaceomarginata]|nr:Arl8a protein [Mycena olivaceomarginata]
MASFFRVLVPHKYLRLKLTPAQASGKTSFVNVIGSGQVEIPFVPPSAVRKGNVTLTIWDVAGQPKFRTFSQPEKFNTARFELHQLISQPTLSGVPLLVLGNKNDLDGHVPVKDLIRDLQLDKITDRPVSCSMKSQHNLDIVLQWLA